MANRQDNMISLQMGLVAYKVMASQVQVKNIRRIFEMPVTVNWELVAIVTDLAFHSG